MNDNLKKEMQVKLVEALLHVPSKTVQTKLYFHNLFELYECFHVELIGNMYQDISFEHTIDYLTTLDSKFRGMYMLFDCTFDVYIDANELDHAMLKKRKLKSYNEVHVMIFKLIIYTLNETKKDLQTKLTIKNTQTMVKYDAVLIKNISDIQLFWDKSESELDELLLAIFCSNSIVSIKGDEIAFQKFVDFFSIVLHFPVYDAHKVKSAFKNRKKTLTPFLDSLTTACRVKIKMDKYVVD